jgi:hypothetical protein
MTSQQYEELCRLFVSNIFQIGVDSIHNLEYVNPQRPGIPKYSHQIDLYWETETPGARYLHIANAKWRQETELVGQAEVLLLQQVKTKLAAHKALLITSSGFTPQAVAAAADEGIGLHVVRPNCSFGGIEATDPEVIQGQLRNLARAYLSRPLYVHEVMRKSFPASESAPASLTQEYGDADSPPAAPPVILEPPVPEAGAAVGPARWLTRAGYFNKQGPPPGIMKKG